MKEDALLKRDAHPLFFTFFPFLPCSHSPHSLGLCHKQVHAVDLERLEEDAFLNDTIMDFYLRCVHGAWNPLTLLPTILETHTGPAHTLSEGPALATRPSSPPFP